MRRYGKLLIRYLKEQRLRVFLLAVLLFSTAGLELINPQILRYFIDAAYGTGSLRSLIQAALLFIAVALLEQLARIGATYLSETVGWTATNALRVDLARHVLHLDMGFHNAHTPGELIERIDSDVTGLANFFSQFVILVVGNALVLIGMLFLLFREHWLVGTAMAALVILALVVINFLRDLNTSNWVSARQSSSELAGFFEERLAGIEDIRTSGATAYKLRMLYELMRTLMLRYRKARVVGSFTFVSFFLVQSLALAVGIGLGAYLFERGEMTIGTVFLISYYGRLLTWPVREIVTQMEDLQKAGASLARIEELTHIESRVQDGPGAVIPPGPLPVAFGRVSFEYQPGNPVLSHISFELRAGKVLGLLGRTGSGKSTLSRLLFRLYDPSQGFVRLGDTDLRAARLAELHQRIGVVTQEVQLFRGTVRDNLTFFDRAVSDERILAAIEDLELASWYASLPQGLDTILAAGGSSSAHQETSGRNGSHAIGLSAGEAQILAFTRVFLTDPSLIVLDEASSRLDPATERLIERAVDRLLQNRTGIIIAHRLGTVQRVDEIMILEAGRIVEYGDRQVLATNPTSQFAQLLNTGLEEALA